MTTQTIKSTVQQIGELAAPKISKVMDSQVHAANSQAVGTPVTRKLVATVPALAILVASALAVSTGVAAEILQALLWASGLVLIAFAIGSKETGFGAQLFSGLALLLVSLVSATVAIEIAMVGAALVAAWVSAAILRF